MTGPSGNSEFCFPRPQCWTLRVSGKQTHCFPRGQSSSAYCYVTWWKHKSSTSCWCNDDTNQPVETIKINQWFYFSFNVLWKANRKSFLRSYICRQVRLGSYVAFLPCRIQFISPVPQPMPSTAELALFAKSCTSAKQVDDLAIDSENTFVT